MGRVREYSLTSSIASSIARSANARVIINCACDDHLASCTAMPEEVGDIPNKEIARETSAQPEETGE